MSTAPASAPATDPASALADRGPERFEPIALILAILLPGLGHAFLGEIRRAVLIAVGVLGLFVSGLLIGTIDVVDRKDNPIWFFGQALIGPVAFGVDAVHQNFLKIEDKITVPDPRQPTRSIEITRRRTPNPDENPRHQPSLGRSNEFGTLLSTIAGMLNLLVIIDAAFHARRTRDPAIEAARRLLQTQKA